MSVFGVANSWAFDMTPTPTVLTVIAVVGIAIMGVVWFGLKFWLASTRPVNIKEVQTPTLDRLNRQALEAMGDEDEDGDEEAPEELKNAVDEPGEQAR